MHTCMTLDQWLQVGGVLRRSNALLLQLREQVTAAIAWKALEVPWRLSAPKGLGGETM